MASSRTRSLRPVTVTKRVLWRFWHSIFQPASRYPADPRAVFILALSVFSGLTALAVDAAPATLEATIPEWGVRAWGATLILGSLVTLIGMYRQTSGGIITEQIGSVMVAAATLFYSTLAFYILGLEAVQIVGIVMAWGFACLLRWVQLQALIVKSIRMVESRDSVRHFMETGETPR